MCTWRATREKFASPLARRLNALGSGPAQKRQRKKRALTPPKEVRHGWEAQPCRAGLTPGDHATKFTETHGTGAPKNQRDKGGDTSHQRSRKHKLTATNIITKQRRKPNRWPDSSMKHVAGAMGVRRCNEKTQHTQPPTSYRQNCARVRAYCLTRRHASHPGQAFRSNVSRMWTSAHRSFASSSARISRAA